MSLVNGESGLSKPVQTILEEKLEWAERCLRAAGGHVRLQEARIAELEQAGADTVQVRALLMILLETQRMHQSECKQLRKQIEDETPREPSAE